MVAYTAALEVQTAMRAKWIADSTLMALVAGVFDGVPENQALPYIAKGASTEIPWMTFGPNGEGKEVTMVWDVFWEAGGDEGGIAIINEMNRLVHHKILTLVNYVNVLTECELWTIIALSTIEQALYVNHIMARYTTYNYPA